MKRTNSAFQRGEDVRMSVPFEVTMSNLFRVGSDHNQAVVDALSSQIVLSGKFTDEHVISGKVKVCVFKVIVM